MVENEDMKQLDYNLRDAEHKQSSSKLSILEYLENTLGRFGTSTTFNRLEFPSEKHLRHRLWLIWGKIPKETGWWHNFLFPLLYSISGHYNTPVKLVQKWLQFHDTGFSNYSDVQLTFRLFNAIMTYPSWYQSCSAVIFLSEASRFSQVLCKLCYLTPYHHIFS